LNQKYNEDRVEKMRQAVIDCCNQKCRDAYRTLARASAANDDIE